MFQGHLFWTLTKLKNSSSLFLNKMNDYLPNARNKGGENTLNYQNSCIIEWSYCNLGR